MPGSAGNCRFSQPEICSGDHWSTSFCATRHRSSAWRARRQGFGRARRQARLSASLAVGAAAAVTPDLSADSRGRSFEALCDPPYRPTGGNAPRNLFALLKPQRYQSPPAWRWSNPSIASQDPIDAALVPPLKRPRDVRHTLTALPALPQLSLLFRREPCPCMPLHSHTSSSAKIRRCCVDSLNSPPKADIRIAAKKHRYSITSSARASSVVGTSRPSAFAVFRLIASSYLVGACTGRSAGFSPLRMRST